MVLSNVHSHRWARISEWDRPKKSLSSSTDSPKKTKIWLRKENLLSMVLFQPVVASRLSGCWIFVRHMLRTSTRLYVTYITRSAKTNVCVFWVQTVVAKPHKSTCSVCYLSHRAVLLSYVIVRSQIAGRGSTYNPILAYAHSLTFYIQQWRLDNTLDFMHALRALAAKYRRNIYKTYSTR